MARAPTRFGRHRRPRWLRRRGRPASDHTARYRLPRPEWLAGVRTGDRSVPGPGGRARVGIHTWAPRPKGNDDHHAIIEPKGPPGHGTSPMSTRRRSAGRRLGTLPGPADRRRHGHGRAMRWSLVWLGVISGGFQLCGVVVVLVVRRVWSLPCSWLAASSAWPRSGSSPAPGRRSCSSRPWSWWWRRRWPTRGSASTPASTTAPTRPRSTRWRPGS